MTKRKHKSRGNGLGPHHEVSPMGHSTRTKTREDRRRRSDRRSKQKGWT